jgi:ureidoglycolate lyase
MKTYRLNLKPLTQEAFAPFGDVIQKEGRYPEEINYGQTRKYAGLARIDLGDDEGTATVHIYRSRPVSLPFRIEIMEYHPSGSQAFIPLHRRPFLVIVAPPAETLPFKSIQGFITNGEQGVNLKKAVWHHYQLSLDETCDYLVIERDGPGVNTIEQHLEKALFIEEFM